MRQGVVDNTLTDEEKEQLEDTVPAELREVIWWHERKYVEKLGRRIDQEDYKENLADRSLQVVGPRLVQQQTPLQLGLHLRIVLVKSAVLVGIKFLLVLARPTYFAMALHSIFHFIVLIVSMLRFAFQVVLMGHMLAYN